MVNYHQWVLELAQDSSWQLVTVQDYRLQKAKEIFTNTSENTEIIIDNSSQDKSQNESKISISKRLSHKEMSELTHYSVSTIRSKASKGESITTRDGLIYRYDKDPKVLKWARV